MKISVFMLIVLFFVISHVNVAYGLEPEIKIGHIIHTEAAHGDAGGIWKKKILWKARWIQEWKTKTITIPFWKKVWSPVEINEWIPKLNLPPSTPHVDLNGA